MEGLKTSGWVCKKHETIKKVTASQDGGFVEGLKTFDWVCEKHGKIEGGTSSQDEWGRVALPAEIGCW